MKCGTCDATVDLTMSACPRCGAAIELGRLTGILGIVCRACDAYNDPGARTCAACGKPLGDAEATPASTAAPARAAPRAGQAPASGAKTRIVPIPKAVRKQAPEEPAVTPVPLVATCPRCGAETGDGRLCARCGQPLGVRGTQVVMKAIPPAGRPIPQVAGGLAPGRARLVLEAGAGRAGETFKLAADAVPVGRAKGAIAFPEDDCLAPHHATFLFRRGGLHVRDEGGPGGVLLRLRAASVPLRPGDEFAVGERLLRYAGPLPPPPAPPPDGTRRLGAPRPPPPAIVLEERLEGGAPGRVFVRGGTALTIGGAGCAVSLGDDPTVSPSHAELRVDAAGNVRLEDRGSATGTYLRLPPHAERELHDGDRVRIGREVLRVAVT